MPEGPEIYRMAQKISQAVGNKPLTEVWFAFDALKPWSSQLESQQLQSVETRGKALLLCFDNGQTIYTHNQLYGRWMFSSPDRRPDTRRQLRLAISTARRSALLYSASDIEVFEPDQIATHPFIARIGLDILSADVNHQQVADWIEQPKFARRRLGHLLLDQSYLAGVGNYLRSEILFCAGIKPERRPIDLSVQARQRLADAAVELMWRSATTGGITNDLDRVERLKVAGWKRRDYRHYVFGREGQACFDCASPIIKATISGRRLYSCPSCQS